MPNRIHNRLVVTGEGEQLSRFVVAAEDAVIDEETGERAPLDFERHVPTPAALLARLDRPARSPARSPARDDGWFRWRRENWGTKWNAMWPSREGDPRDGTVTYKFATAWAPPEAWLRRVSEQHPELVFELESIEEFLQGSGGWSWSAGALVDSWPVDPEAADWIELSHND